MAASPDSVFQSLDNGNSPLELLMIGSSSEDAARIAAALRNSGQPVRLESTETREGLLRLLETEPADLVTINADATALPPEEAIEMVREENPAASIILLSEHPPKWAEYASQAGLRDLLHSISTGRLVFAIQREYQTLLLRQELARLRDQLQGAEARFQKLLRSTRDAVAYLHEGTHIQSNPVYQELFGLSPEDMRGLTMLDLVAPEDRDDFRRLLKRARKEEFAEQELLFRHRQGGTFRARISVSPTQVHDEHCVQVIIRTEGAEDELQARINELIDRDPQTRLLNRHAFVRALESIQSGQGLPEDGLLMGVSIDNFAELCDREGLDRADCLLNEAAETLRGHFGGDLLSRFGDHEFLVLTRTDQAPDSAATACLDVLHQADLRSRCELDEEPEFSLGVIPTRQSEGLSALELVRRCRRAARRAREEREIQNEPISVFNDEMSGFADPGVNTEIVDMIDGALERDGFRLLYQPIVSLEGDTRENYSIFVRLLDSRGIEREPAWFYRHADQSERLGEIDRWVIRRAISELSRHRRNGKKVNFHITLSREGALDDSMLLWVCDCLREFKAKGAWLYFQFELGLLRENRPELVRLTEGLRKINCRISCNGIDENFDDYDLLVRYGVSMARLAPRLSGELTTSEQRQARLSEINRGLQQREIRTVATGIEHADTLAILWNIGVNYIQGYFLQEPAPTIELEEH